MSGAGEGAGPDQYQQTLLDLYNKSLLKQAKFRAIARYLPNTADSVCLDVGADNGVLSYLLRERRGTWYSADLDADIVAGIARMVGERVLLIDGGRTEFQEDYFDLVVIIDFLEHIEDDEGFVTELARIMKSGATLIVNVPHDRPRSWIRRLRLAVGLTDEIHGHVRPGYDMTSLQAVLGGNFRVEGGHNYSGFFVELFDVFTSVIFDRLSGGEGSQKGTVVTGEDLQRHSGKFRAYRIIYPVVWLLSQLDKLLFFMPGHSLIVQAKREEAT